MSHVAGLAGGLRRGLLMTKEFLSPLPRPLVGGFQVEQLSRQLRGMEVGLLCLVIVPPPRVGTGSVLTEMPLPLGY